MANSSSRELSGPALALQGHEVPGPAGPGLVGLAKSRGPAGPGSVGLIKNHDPIGPRVRAGPG